MTEQELRNLHAGDEVFWTDPDEGACSRTYRISTIKIKGEVVCITDTDGATLEAFASELS